MKLNVEETDFDSINKEHFERCPADQPYLGERTYKEYIHKGAFCLELKQYGETKWIALAQEQFEHYGKELEIICTYSVEERQSGIFKDALEALAEYANLNGFKSVKFSTRRYGMKKVAETAGYHLDEIMMRKVLL